MINFAFGLCVGGVLAWCVVIPLVQTKNREIAAQKTQIDNLLAWEDEIDIEIAQYEQRGRISRDR